MKRMVFIGIFVQFCIMGIFAQQPVVAVAPFDAISGVSASDANLISRAFNIRLGNTHKVKIVDREIVERVLKEHAFQAGDWSNEDKTAELGKALNANWIVRGNFERFGSNILFTVSFYDIRTFQFRGGDELRIANADAAYDAILPMINNLISVIEKAEPDPVVPSRPSGQIHAAPATQMHAAPAAQAYKIGDTGPGGGIVFFIEGNTFMEVSGMLGEYNQDSAIQTAKDYKGGGFTDWRLPSKDELDSIYQNLQKKGIVNFGSGQLWSSSSAGGLNGWVQRFSDGRQDFIIRRSLRGIRAVRSFRAN